MENNKKFASRKKLNLGVKGEFQRWLLKRLAVTIMVSALLAAFILYFYARQEVMDTFFDAHIRLRRVSDLLLPVVAVGSAVSLVAGGFLALFLPQKIAGPIYRIEQCLKKIAAGDLTTEIKLRDNDTLKDLAGNTNDAVSSLRNQVHAVKEKQLELTTAVQSWNKEQINRLLQQQQELLGKLKT